ncbi:MAG: A24 family peptidase [Clostridiaceae bacterium]
MFVMYIYIFVVGIVLGSFLNVVILRVPEDKSIIYPPSHCTNCGNRLKIIDLIPIFSYVFLGGKCRYCKEKISPIYPLIEFINGIVYLYVFYTNGISWLSLQYSLLFSVLLVISMIDYRTQLVDDKIIIFGFVLMILFEVINKGFTKQLFDNLYGALLGGGIIALIVIITHGMGEGDIEIFSLTGFVLGFRLTLLALWLSFVIGGVVAILLLVLKIKNRKDAIAFGPYICFGSYIALLYGNEIMKLIF